MRLPWGAGWEGVVRCIPTLPGIFWGGAVGDGWRPAAGSVYEISELRHSSLEHGFEHRFVPEGRLAVYARLATVWLEEDFSPPRVFVHSQPV